MAVSKNYLPSKKFTYLLVGFVILGIIVLVISNIFFGKTHFSNSNENGKLATKITLENLLQNDSDGDGVMDWEEALWGTDPSNKATFDYVPDNIYIKKKKNELKLTEGNLSEEGKELTETDKFAQEFFASMVAMKQSGQTDKNAIKNVSTALGQKIAEPTIINKYSEKDVKIDEKDGVMAQKNYYLTVKKLFENEEKKGLGDELEIAGAMVSSSDNEEINLESAEKLEIISGAYQEFAQKVISTPAPTSLILYHIKIANNANNTGIAVKNMTKILNDPLVGLSGLSQYQKYSDDLISSVGELETILLTNGIIME